MKERGWVVGLVFWPAIDSWEMESLPRFRCVRTTEWFCHSCRERVLKIGKVDCKAMRVVLLDGYCSQAKEGMWGMPGHTEAMKAVVSCEKLRGVAHTR